MTTDDTEDYIITRTNADVHGQCGGLQFHSDDHGWPRRTFESSFQCFSIEYPWTSVIIRVKNNIESSHRCSWNVTEDYYIYGTRARASHTCICNTMRVITRKDMRQSSTLHHAARENPQVLAAPCYLLLSLQFFFEKKPTFPTPGKEKVSKIWLFRVKDRVQDSSPLRLILHHQPRFCRIKAPFRVEWCRMREEGQGI